jgi:hypothetical protein
MNYKNVVTIGDVVDLVNNKVLNRDLRIMIQDSEAGTIRFARSFRLDTNHVDWHEKEPSAENVIFSDTPQEHYDMG